MEAFETGKVAVGMRSVLKGLQRGEIKNILIAEDTDTFIRNKVINACALYQVPYEQKFTKAQIGEMATSPVPTAVVGMIKSGPDNEG